MKHAGWLVWLPLLLGFSSCAIHPCGKAMCHPRRSDFRFTHFKGKSHEYEIAFTPHKGSPILVTHGLGGLDPATLEWAERLGNHGWQVYLPLLDGDFNACDISGHKARIEKSGRWDLHNPHSSGQVLEDVGSMADWVSIRHQQRIVVVGNCLTGGFPLALLGRPTVKTAVLCQPAMPIKSAMQVIFCSPQSPAETLGFGIPDAKMQASLDALRSDKSKRLYGFHYLNDHLAPFDKFNWLHRELERRGVGAKFKPIVLVPKALSVNESWYEPMVSTAHPSFIGPHVTLTGADIDDRMRLQDRFDQLVRP